MLRMDLIDSLIAKNLKLGKAIRKENQVSGSDDEPYAFIAAGLRRLFPSIKDEDLKNSITDDYHDQGIDAIYICGRDVHVFDFKTSPNFGRKEVKEFRDGIRDFLFDDSGLDGLPNRLKVQIPLAREKIEQQGQVIPYVVRRLAQAPNPEIIRVLDGVRSDGLPCSPAKFLDGPSLIDMSLEEQSQQNDCVWQIQTSWHEFTSSKHDKIIVKQNGSTRALIAPIPLIEIVKLQGEFVKNQRNLFAANVRAFHNNRKLSRKIMESLTEAPDEFYMRHNGLTFSCTDIEPRRNKVYKIHNPQIINGCQTVNTVWKAASDKIVNDTNLGKANVLCRFYALDGGAVETVCEATNTQVHIAPWDLRRNDRIQCIIEDALQIKKLNYARKYMRRGKGRILITDLAQWIYAAKHQQPQQATNSKACLFERWADTEETEKGPYPKIFHDRWKLDDLMRICVIGLFVADKIGEIRKDKRNTYHENARLYYVAGIYDILKGKGKPTHKKFAMVDSAIKKVIKRMQQQQGEKFNYNRLFSKDTSTWGKIKRALHM